MPEVSFYTNDEGQCFRDQDFIFLNTSSILEGQFDLTWNFGGKTFVKSNTDQKHMFADTGSHFVRLVANSDLGCMDSMTQFLFVNPNPKSVLFLNDSDQCINAQNYIFTANSNISRGKIIAHHWNLDEGDARMNGGSVEAKTYSNSGFKTIRLVNVSDSGCIDSAVRVVRVYPRPTALIGINDSAQCLFQNQYVFNNLSTDSFSLIRQWWNINTEKSEITSNVNYRFLSPGFKRIYLTVESSVGCFDSVSRAVFVKPMPDPLFAPLREYYCEGSGNYVLTPNTTGGVFYGKNMVGSDLIPTVLWKDTIRYIITVNGCTDSSSQTTWIYPYPRVNLGADSILCKDELLELSIDNWNTQYVWDDGSVLPARRIVKPGLYWVTATNICGVAADSLNIEFRDYNCRVYCPTAFTPNSDSKNDYFRPIVYNVEELTYYIYNRWGEKLFEGTENDLGWDGTFGGNMVQSGSYIIMYEYKYKSGNRLLRGSEQVVFHLLK
jgi:gliding motility-associated-like protein